MDSGLNTRQSVYVTGLKVYTVIPVKCIPCVGLYRIYLSSILQEAISLLTHFRKSLYGLIPCVVSYSFSKLLQVWISRW
jgi:hypothetical protein